jgi:LmbE family N-acetylglucosaminyl deacetylase
MQKSRLFQGNDRVLVVAAHPDDEVLGCGATMARHVDCGDEVSVVITAEGVTSRDYQRNVAQRHEQLSTLKSISISANKILGVTDIHFLGFPDNRMDEVPFLDVVKQIEKVKSLVNPTVVYTHFPGDLNIDHRITSDAVATAFRPQPNETAKLIAFFEVLSSTNWSFQTRNTSFVPNLFIGVEQWLERKIMALHSYSEEMRPWPHSRSYEAVKHQAGNRGSDVGVAAAESFMIFRHLIS